MKKTILPFALVLGFGVSLLTVACVSDAPVKEAAVAKATVAVEKPDTRPIDVQKMETALGVNHFFSFAGVSYDLKLIFGGSPRFDGTIVQTGDMDRIHLQQEESTMVYDGDHVHVSTRGELDTKSARFSALTWPYFFSLPFKLRDPGTKLEAMGDQVVGGVNYKRAKLSFSAGTGDAPDDWYLLYFDGGERLAAAAYIVTFGGRSAEDAIASAHAICYHDYATVDGVEIAQNWTFHDWSESEGWTKKIGEAAVSNVGMLKELPVDAFAIPAGAIAAGAP